MRRLHNIAAGRFGRSPRRASFAEQQQQADRFAEALFESASAPIAPALEVSTGERRAADLFWADLVGRPAVPLRRGPSLSVGEAAVNSTPPLLQESASLGASGAPAVGAAPPPPRRTYPAALTRLDGIDVYEENDIPSMSDIAGAGVSFVIHRCSI